MGISVKIPEWVGQGTTKQINVKFPVGAIGFSLARKKALLVTHPDWASGIDVTRAVLRTRGYVVHEVTDGREAVAQIAKLASAPRSGDQIFVYLAVHGSGDRTAGDTTISTAHRHGFGPATGYFTFGEVADHFRRIANAGVQLIVFDGSCEGGESVVGSIGERYAVLSTTCASRPGGTTHPIPGQVMAQYGQQSSFGLWWSEDDAASRLSAYGPFRFFQKIYRNDDTEMARLSLFTRSGLFHYLLPGDPWTMEARGCYLWRYLDPGRFDALAEEQKATMVGSVDAYLDSMQADYDAFAPVNSRFIEILNDQALVSRAGKIYAQHFERVWRNLFRDTEWDVRANPVKETPGLNLPIDVLVYEGEQGFSRIAAEVVLTLIGWQHHFREQTDLIRQLDAEVKRTGLRIPSLIDEVRIVDRSPAAQIAFAHHLDAQQIALRTQLSSVGRSPLDLLKVTKTSPDRLLPRIGTLRRLVWRPEGERKSRVAELARDLAALRIARAVQAEKLWYLLAIVEEAISRAQEAGQQPGDIARF